MDIFETRLIRIRRIFRFIVPILFAAVLCLIFYLGIARTQTDSVVEYVPNGSNLLPSISVLPVNARKGGAR